MAVRRPRGQARVVDQGSHREVVEILESVAGQSEQLRKGVIEVAADPRPPAASASRQSTCPRKPAAWCWCRYHHGPRSRIGSPKSASIPRLKRLVGGDRLVASHDPRHVLLGQEEEAQVVRAGRRTAPEEPVTECGLGVVVHLIGPLEQVAAWRQGADTMDEQSEVEVRSSRQHVPGGHSGSRQEAVEDGVEDLGRDRGPAVESQAVPADERRRGDRAGGGSGCWSGGPRSPFPGS